MIEVLALLYCLDSGVMQIEKSKEIEIIAASVVVSADKEPPPNNCYIITIEPLAD